MTNMLDVKIRDKGESKVPVMGIPEWQGWYPNYDPSGLPQYDPREAIDKCIDAHLAVGVDHIIWSCGRSTLTYRTELETATLNVRERLRPIITRICPLRRALEYGEENNAFILGRLCMNRHYSEDYPNLRSDFVRDNPEFLEKSKSGGTISHRLCYGLEEVQQERIDILLELQRIGVKALVLDFCRQMPMLLYHESVVTPYLEKTGEDPREIHSTRHEDYTDWFQYRADILTGFMQKLRREVRKQEKKLGRACPIIARIPDSAPWLMIAYGLDIDQWFEEDLVDGSMLSPFPRTLDDLNSYPEYHAKTAHQHGKFCIGGIGSLNLMRPRMGTRRNFGFFHPKPAYQRVEKQYKAGVDAVSLYQSECLVRLEYLTEFIREMGDIETVSERIVGLSDPDSDLLFSNASSEESIGLDWHSGYCLPKCKITERLSEL